MNLNHATNKENGSTLSAQEWNSLAADVNELGAGGAGTGSSEYINITSKGNVEISSPKNVNIEPAGDETNNVWGDISLKPGDDIEFLSEHRPQDKQDEVSLKVHNGNKKPVKLQVNAAEFTLTTKDKEGTDANVLDVNINSGKNSKGYLKVRAQAIDLRCEENGGIALQPKGNDGDGHENKIKFEHDGGDGKEFGTFNTEKTSIFTDEYRFNEDGVVYAVTRGPLETTYKVENDPTSGIKKIDYPTQADDFKDILDNTKSCTWNDIIVAVNYIKSQNPSLGWTPAAA